MRIQRSADASGDGYEQEADRVAGQVLRMPEPRLRRGCACGGGCPACRAARQPAGRVQETGRGDPAAPPIVDEVVRSPGQPLDAETRGFMEARFGRDFSGVRVHADDRAARSARAVAARAYTVGRDIAFGAGKYRPQTAEGKRLLAHELTHVVHQSGGSDGVPGLQRAGEEETEGARTGPGTVRFVGCDQSPFTADHVRHATEEAYNTARDCKGIKSESLRKDILAGFDGLTIVCVPERVEGRCAETLKSSRTVRLYNLSLDGSYCPSLLEATIFHELVHVAERWNPFEGKLPYDCGEACFPDQDLLHRGDASKCEYERSWLPFLGASSGVAIPEKGASTGYVRIFAGLEKRGPVISIVRPSIGIGVSIIGDRTTGAGEELSPGSSTLLSLIGGLRFDPGKEGRGYWSLSLGPELSFSADGVKPGYEVGVGAGYRWHVYDVSVNAGIEYDPTQRQGEEKMYTIGATFQIAPKVRR